jgi:hypothetical protein
MLPVPENVPLFVSTGLEQQSAESEQKPAPQSTLLFITKTTTLLAVFAYLSLLG